MKFLYGLALALIFFEGFIRQCECVDQENQKRHQPEEASTSTNLRNLLQDLPINVYEEILSKTGFKATEQAAKDGERTLAAIKKIFESRIIYIIPAPSESRIIETEVDGKMILTIGGGNRILSLFKNFGYLVKRMRVDYDFIDEVDDDIRHQIKENIFIKCAGQFAELDIIAWNSMSSFLVDISDGGEREICFLNVKQLSYSGGDFRSSYDLNSIFPNLGTLTLCRFHLYVEPIFISQLMMRTNMTCMKNVTNLKELKLLINPESYELPELEKIFKKNKQLSSFAVVLIDKIDILHLIEAHMKTVETLEIYIDGTEFLDRVSGNHKFEMPNIKKLILRGESIIRDLRIINLIKSFKKLKTLHEMVIKIDLHISDMEKLIEFQELITNDNSIISNIKKAMGIFGRHKKLNIKMWAFDFPSTCNTYRSKVIEFNDELMQSHKPTWEIDSYEYETWNTMTFLRSE